MQSVSSRIWTRIAVSISYDDNHYTMAPPIITIHITAGQTIIENFFSLKSIRVIVIRLYSFD